MCRLTSSHGAGSCGSCAGAGLLAANLQHPRMRAPGFTSPRLRDERGLLTREWSSFNWCFRSGKSWTASLPCTVGGRQVSTMNSTHVSCAQFLQDIQNGTVLCADKYSGRPQALRCKLGACLCHVKAIKVAGDVGLTSRRRVSDSAKGLCQSACFL